MRIPEPRASHRALAVSGKSLDAQGTEKKDDVAAEAALCDLCAWILLFLFIRRIQNRMLPMKAFFKHNSCGLG